jgi:co-chaperonin GroES (HSP10)
VHGCLICLPDNQKKASRLTQGLVFQSWNNKEEEEEEEVVVVIEEEEMMGCVL